MLHGGAQHGSTAVRPWSPAYVRMLQLALVTHRAIARHGIEVRLLRNRVRGWNSPQRDPVSDGRWAMDGLRARHPDVPVGLLGHSMGGRVALRIADDPQVVALCALAPWTRETDWVSQLGCVRTLIAHGTDDSVTGPEDSYAYAKRAAEVTRVVRFELHGEGHRMVRRAGTWNRLVRAFAFDAFDLPTSDCRLADLRRDRPSDCLRIRV